MSAKQCRIKGAVLSTLVGVGLLLGAQARGDEPQTEVYNGLANTPGMADFWDTTGYTGTCNPVGVVSINAFVLGSGAEAGTLAGSAGTVFTPFCFHLLDSPARPLNSRPPQGLAIFFR